MSTNLSSPSQVSALLRRLDFQPSRVLGQNFLIDGNTLRILLDLIEASPDDTILEVGPGLGVLTGPLLERARRVIAVEKDARLFEFLSTRFAGMDSLTLMQADIMAALHTHDLLRQVTGIASNLPYSIAGRFLVDLSLARPTPRRAVLTVQQEVAERLTAASSTKAYGALTVFCQTAFNVRMHRIVPPSCFYPRPQVQSAIVVLERREETEGQDPATERFRRLVRHAFSQRRKQFAVLLSRAPAPLNIPKQEAEGLLETLGIKGNARPEDVPPEHWMQLARQMIARDANAGANHQAE